MTQQEVMALQQVSIQNGLYTSMLNNIQQLRVVRVGELGNVRVVDYAEITQYLLNLKENNLIRRFNRRLFSWLWFYFLKANACQSRCFKLFISGKRDRGECLCKSPNHRNG